MNTKVMFDLEATCWNTGPLAPVQHIETEIIEIGAVKLDPETHEIIDEFQTFVRPAKHPMLSDYCKELTTIEQVDVNNAPNFAGAYEQFCSWIGNPSFAEVGSWGKYDQDQIRKEARDGGLPYPAWYHNNVKVEFSKFNYCHGRSRKGKGLKRAALQLNIEFEGVQHRGIDDARMVGRIYKHIRDPKNMSTNAKNLLKVVVANSGCVAAAVKDAEVFSDFDRWYGRTLEELKRLELITRQRKVIYPTKRGKEWVVNNGE